MYDLSIQHCFLHCYAGVLHKKRLHGGVIDGSGSFYFLGIYLAMLPAKVRKQLDEQVKISFVSYVDGGAAGLW